TKIAVPRYPTTCFATLCLARIFQPHRTPGAGPAPASPTTSAPSYSERSMPSSKFSLRLDGPTNVGTAERALSLLAGGILALDGLRRRTPLGALEAVLAAALVERG